MACLGSAGSLWLLGGGWAVEWGDPGGRGGGLGQRGLSPGRGGGSGHREERSDSGRGGKEGAHWWTRGWGAAGKGRSVGGRGGEACALNVRLCPQQCFSGLLHTTDACRWASRGPSTRGKEEVLSRLPRVEHGA